MASTTSQCRTRGLTVLKYTCLGALIIETLCLLRLMWLFIIPTSILFGKAVLIIFTPLLVVYLVVLLLFMLGTTALFVASLDHTAQVSSHFLDQTGEEELRKACGSPDS